MQSLRYDTSYVFCIFQDSSREIENLVKFLGLSTSKDLCSDVADKCKFENMKEDKKGLESPFWTSAWRNNKPGFYRKGWFSRNCSQQMSRNVRKRTFDHMRPVKIQINLHICRD